MITVDLFRSSKTKHPVYSCNYNRERSAGTKLVSLYFQNSIFILTDKWFLPIFAFKQLPDNTSLMVWVLRIKLLRRRAAGRFCPLCAFSLSSSQKRPKIPTSDVNTQCTILTFVTVFSVSDASPSCCRFFAGWPTSCVWFCSSLKKSLFNWRRPCSHSLTVVDVFFFVYLFLPPSVLLLSSPMCFLFLCRPGFSQLCSPRRAFSEQGPLRLIKSASFFSGWHLKTGHGWCVAVTNVCVLGQ